MPIQNNSTIRHHVSAERVHVDNGFFTAMDSALHVYLHDIQGGVLAVFNTPDVSPYTFCAGDPINYSDPTGLFRDKKEGEKYAAKYWPGCPVLINKATGGLSYQSPLKITLMKMVNSPLQLFE